MNKQDYPGLVWWRMAALYFLAGILLGLGMGIAADHTLFGVHAHLNLLGWASLAIIGLIYQHLPNLAGNRVAKLQFWLHNLGLPVMMVGLTGKMLGHAQFEPLLVCGALVVGVSVLLFTYNLLFNLRA